MSRNPAWTPSLERTSLAESVYETLLEAIVAGRISAGEELNAVALADQLDVSRTPVQEALRRLASDGLVELLPGRVARLAHFGPRDLAEIYDLRQLLEGAAARRAALRMPPEQVANLRIAGQTLLADSSAIDWTERALAADLDFHEAVAAAAGNIRLAAEVGRQRRLVRGFCRLSASVEHLRQAWSEHLVILAALEARDPDAAEAAMTAHIEARFQTVLTLAFPDSPSAVPAA